MSSRGTSRWYGERHGVVLHKPVHSGDEKLKEQPMSESAVRVANRPSNRATSRLIAWASPPRSPLVLLPLTDSLVKSAFFVAKLTFKFRNEVGLHPYIC